MNTSSVLQSGLQGIHSGMNGLQKTATKIANLGTESNPVTLDNVAESLVDLKIYEVGVKASAKVVKSADDMLGTLLDTFA